MTSSHFCKRSNTSYLGNGYMFVLPWEPVGSSGVNQVVLNLLHQFEIHGDMRPILLIQSWKHDVPETEVVGKQIYIRYRVRSADSVSGSLRGFAAFCFLLPKELWGLRRLLKTNAVTAINIHYPGLATTSFSILKFLGAYRGRLMLTFHGLDLKLAAETRGWRGMLWKWNGLQADIITACSAALARDLVDAFPAWKGRIRPIHNGLEVGRFAATSEQGSQVDPTLRGRRYILNVGTFETKKGQDVLVRAFHTLSSRFQELLLVLVGGAGPTRPGLEALVAELGLKERVVFRENIDHAQMAAFYRHAAVFALPSRSEPFGIAILEAGAFGVPVVASRVGGVPEIISSAESGILVEPDDPEQLSAALESLVAEPALARAMGACLQQRVIQEFSWVGAYRQYLFYAVAH